MRPDDDPLGSALSPFLCGPRAERGLVLAVSGGPDSTALMHAAAASGISAPMFVATVDHGLRPDSAREAGDVAAAAARLGLSHTRLVWSAPKPARGLPAAARAARYRLLGDFAGTVGAGLVLTGHTCDDQAETVLMRLIAGSGPAGLAGMRRERDLTPGTRLGRPFLALPKAVLVTYCEARGIAYARDPTNGDDRFTRARLRRLMPRLAREGLTADRLRRLAERSARDDAALSGAARYAFALALRPRADAVVLDATVLAELPEAVLLRVMASAIEQVGAGGPVRLERLERLVLGDLLPALKNRAAMRRTLAEVMVSTTVGGEVVLHLAPARRAGRTPSPVSLAAGTPDLLGKEESAAYIGFKWPD